MGLLQPADWQAQWIGRTQDPNSLSAPLLRREFQLEAGSSRPAPTSAAWATSSCTSTAGESATTSSIPATPATTARLYVTYDVTDLVKRGQNAVGVILGNGWYNVPNKAVWDFHKAPWRAAPRLLCRSRSSTRTDGRTTIASDGTWRTADGPIVFNSIYSGEIYDARLEKPGWDTADFDDSRLEPGPAGRAAQGQTRRPDDAAHPGRPGPQAGQDHRAEARRLRLRHRPEPRRLRPAPRAGPAGTGW